jgi:hypothetical protein
MAKACADAIAVDRQRARDQEEEEKDEEVAGARQGGEERAVGERKRVGGMIVAMSRCWRWLQRFVYVEYLLFHIRIRGLMAKTNLVNGE